MSGLLPWGERLRVVIQRGRGICGSARDEFDELEDARDAKDAEDLDDSDDSRIVGRRR